MVRTARQAGRGEARINRSVDVSPLVPSSTWTWRPTLEGTDGMKRKQFSKEQVIGLLKEADAGAVVTELCRKHGMSSATY